MALSNSNSSNTTINNANGQYRTTTAAIASHASGQKSLSLEVMMRRQLEQLRQQQSSTSSNCFQPGQSAIQQQTITPKPPLAARRTLQQLTILNQQTTVNPSETQQPKTTLNSTISYKPPSNHHNLFISRTLNYENSLNSRSSIPTSSRTLGLTHQHSPGMNYQTIDAKVQKNLLITPRSSRPSILFMSKSKNQSNNMKNQRLFSPLGQAKKQQDKEEKNELSLLITDDKKTQRNLNKTISHCEEVQNKQTTRNNNNNLNNEIENNRNIANQIIIPTSNNPASSVTAALSELPSNKTILSQQSRSNNEITKKNAMPWRNLSRRSMQINQFNRTIGEQSQITSKEDKNNQFELDNSHENIFRRTRKQLEQSHIEKLSELGKNIVLNRERYFNEIDQSLWSLGNSEDAEPEHPLVSNVIGRDDSNNKVKSSREEGQREKIGNKKDKFSDNKKSHKKLFKILKKKKMQQLLGELNTDVIKTAAKNTMEPLGELAQTINSSKLKRPASLIYPQTTRGNSKVAEEDNKEFKIGLGDGISFYEGYNISTRNAGNKQNNSLSTRRRTIINAQGSEEVKNSKNNSGFFKTVSKDLSVDPTVKQLKIKESKKNQNNNDRVINTITNGESIITFGNAEFQKNRSSSAQGQTRQDKQLFCKTFVVHKTDRKDNIQLNQKQKEDHQGQYTELDGNNSNDEFQFVDEEEEKQDIIDGQNAMKRNKIRYSKKLKNKALKKRKRKLKIVNHISNGVLKRDRKKRMSQRKVKKVRLRTVVVLSSKNQFKRIKVFKRINNYENNRFGPYKVKEQGFVF